MVDVMNPVSSHCGSYFGPAQQSSAFSGRTAAGGSGSVASECVSPEPSPLGTSASTLSPSSTLGQTTSNTNGSGSYFKEASTNKYRQLFLNYKARDHEKMIRTSRLGELPAKPVSCRQLPYVCRCVMIARLRLGSIKVLSKFSALAELLVMLM